MLKLLFRKDFPESWMDLHKLYVFEVILNDGTMRQAIVSRFVGKTTLYWMDPNTKEVIPEETVLGWRETYNCDAARQDVDSYFRDPISIVAKGHLGDAFARHIEREPCPSCRKYYESKLNPVPVEVIHA